MVDIVDGPCYPELFEGVVTGEVTPAGFFAAATGAENIADRRIVVWHDDSVRR